MALVHCRECGEMIAESAPTCPKCGASQYPSNSGSSYTATPDDKEPNAGLNVLSCLWPFVGFILYLSYMDSSPRRAKACGKWALIGTALWVVACILFFIFIFGAVLTAI